MNPDNGSEKVERYPYARRPAPTGQFIGLPNQQRNDPALRFDADKLRYELLPADGLEELVKVYSAGARKYSREEKYSYEGILQWLMDALEKSGNRLYVTQINLIWHLECAENVMRKTFSKETQNMGLDSSKTQKNGVSEILKELKKEIVVETPTQEGLLDTKPPKEKTDSNLSDSMRKPLMLYFKSRRGVVEFVNVNYPQCPYTLIMTTQREQLEGYYVVAATTVLECLAILLKGLKELCFISETLLPTKLSNDKNKIVLFYTGDRNWEKGMAWSRVFGSLLRHAWAFWKGETLDPETGCHHLAMAAWNCIALCVYDMRKVGEDNRPLNKTENSK